MSIDKINPYIIGYLEVAYSNQQVPEDPNSWDEFWNDQFLFNVFNGVAFQEYISTGEFWKGVDVTQAIHYINSYYSSEYGEDHILQWRNLTMEYLQQQYAIVYCSQHNEVLKRRIMVPLRTETETQDPDAEDAEAEVDLGDDNDAETDSDDVD